MDREKLVEVLNEIKNLYGNEFILFGSGALVMIRLLDECNDIDIIFNDYNKNEITIKDEIIDMNDRVKILNYSYDDLIHLNMTIVVDGIRCFDAYSSITFLQFKNEEKDIDKLETICRLCTEY